MKARPILMSAPMVLATLREIAAPGTGKTQTRRIMKPQPIGNGFIARGELLTLNDFLPPDAMLLSVGKGRSRYTTSSYEGWESACPYGQPGDLLWVRETWSGIHTFCNTPPSERRSFVGDGHPYLREDVWYWADGSTDYGDWEKPRPAIHMPRWASRLTLRITDVRVERLQEISEADALAEGIHKPFGSQFWHADTRGSSLPGESPAWAFRNLWESIKGADSWEANPYVWAITFEPILRNVDDVLREVQS